MAVHSSSGSRSMARQPGMGWRAAGAVRVSPTCAHPAASSRPASAAMPPSTPRKPAWSASSWPASGPSAGDQDSTAPSMMKQRVSASPCRRSRSMVCVVMEQVASPSAWTKRPASSASNPGAQAAHRVPASPVHRPASSAGRRPQASHSQPHSSTPAAKPGSRCLTDCVRGRVQPPVAGQVGQRGREDGFRRLRQGQQGDEQGRRRQAVAAGKGPS